NQQVAPTVGAAADGDFVVAWQSLNQASGTSLNDIYAQRYTDLDNNGDTVGPAVAAVAPSGAPAPLHPGDRLAGPVTGFVVAFTEDMSQAGGATGAGSVLNPANYRLTRNGA